MGESVEREEKGSREGEKGYDDSVDIDVSEHFTLEHSSPGSKRARA